MPHKSFRQESRSDYGRSYQIGEPEPSLTENQLILGASLRAADALEKIAASYTDWKQRAERAERGIVLEREASQRAYRRICALRGVITKLKRQKGGN
jgi:hypothetical protein